MSILSLLSGLLGVSQMGSRDLPSEGRRPLLPGSVPAPSLRGDLAPDQGGPPKQLGGEEDTERGVGPQHCPRWSVSGESPGNKWGCSLILECSPKEPTWPCPAPQSPGRVCRALGRPPSSLAGLPQCRAPTPGAEPRARMPPSTPTSHSHHTETPDPAAGDQLGCLPSANCPELLTRAWPTGHSPQRCWGVTLWDSKLG